MFTIRSSDKHSSDPMIQMFVSIFEEFRDKEWKKDQVYMEELTRPLIRNVTSILAEHKRNLDSLLDAIFEPTLKVSKVKEKKVEQAVSDKPELAELAEPSKPKKTWQFEVHLPEDSHAPVRLVFQNILDCSDAMLAILEKIYPEDKIHALSLSEQFTDVFYDRVAADGTLSNEVFSLERKYYDLLVKNYLSAISSQRSTMTSRASILQRLELKESVIQSAPQYVCAIDTASLSKIIDLNIGKLLPTEFLPLDEDGVAVDLANLTKRFAFGIYQQLSAKHDPFMKEINVLSLGCGIGVIEIIAIKSIFQAINENIKVNFVGVDKEKEVTEAMEKCYANLPGIKLMDGDATLPIELATKLPPNAFDIVVIRHPNVIGQPEVFTSIASKTAQFFAKEQNCAILTCYTKEEFCELTKLWQERILFKHVKIIDSNRNKEIKQIDPIILRTEQSKDGELKYITDQFILISQFNTHFLHAGQTVSGYRLFEKSEHERPYKVYFDAENKEVNSFTTNKDGYLYIKELAEIIGAESVTITSDSLAFNKNWINQLEEEALDQLICGLGMTIEQREQLFASLKSTRRQGLG